MKLSKSFEIIGISMLLVVLFSLIYISGPISDTGITGEAVVRVTPDYQIYKEKMTDEAYKVMAASLSYEKNSYIVELEDYEGDLGQVYDVVLSENVKELSLVDAVGVRAREYQLKSLIDRGIVSRVYADSKVELLRDTAMQQINLSNIRLIGPTKYNMTGDKIKIAIIDTGVNYTHPEFNCVPGADGCFIAKGATMLQEEATIGNVSRTKIENKFVDSSVRKVLDLASGDKTIAFRIRNNNTINMASVDLNATITEVSLNSVRLTQEDSTVDFKDEIESLGCSLGREYCYYNLTFSGSGKILVENLSVNYTFYNDELEGDVMDDHEHGTFVTGIINYIVPDAEIYAYRVMKNSTDGVAEGNVSDTILAIELAMLDDVDIISLSLGVNRFQETCAGKQLPLENAIQKAYDAGITVVAAGGNNATNYVYIPACYNTTVGISSIDEFKSPSSFNNYGSEIDFAMLGSDVYSTAIDGGYLYGSGTSFSAPFASSVFAMLQEFSVGRLGRGLTPAQMKNISITYAEDLDSEGKDDYTGYGLLQFSDLVSALDSTAMLFSTPTTVNVSSSESYNTLELYTNIKDENISLRLTFGNITVSSTGVPIIIDGQTSTYDFELERNKTLYIELNTSVLAGYEIDGNYSANISVTSITHDVSLEVPVNFEHISAEGNPLAGYEYQLATFSVDDIIYTSVEDEVGTLTEPTINVLLFLGNTDTIASHGNDSDGTYVNNPNFNKGYYLDPIFRINSSAPSIIDRMYLKIDTPGGEVILNSSEPMVSEDYAIYEFTVNGDDASVSTTPKDDLVLDLSSSNLYNLSSTGQYDIEVYVVVSDEDTLVDEKTIQVYDNMSILLREGLLFFDDPSSTDFDVIDNRQHVVNKLYYNTYNYNSTLYDYPSISITLDNVTQSAAIYTNNITLALDNSSIAEGLHYLEIRYNTSGNVASLEAPEGDPITVLYPVVLVISNDSSSINETNNLTITLDISKEGNLSADVEINLSLDSSCNDYSKLNLTSFTLDNINNESGTITNSILLWMNDTTAKERSCILTVEQVVYEVCQHCDNETDESYLEIHTLAFDIDGRSPNISIDADVNDSEVKVGEYFDVIVTIENNETEDFSGILYYNTSDGLYATLGSGSESVDILGNSSENITVNFYTTTEGSKTVYFTLDGDGIKKYHNESLVASGNLFTYSISKNNDKVFVNDTLEIYIQINNNNNEDMDETNTDIELKSESAYFDTLLIPSSSFTIPAKSSKTFTYKYSVKTSGSPSFTGDITMDKDVQNINYGVSIESGSYRRITVTGDEESYIISIDDRVSFMTYLPCEDNYDDCNKTCKADNRSCANLCKANRTIYRNERDGCKDNCTANYVDRDDRNDCRADCDDVYEDYEDEFDDCTDDCIDESDDCYDECKDVNDECLDDLVEVEIYTEPDDEKSIYMEIDGENFYGQTITEGDTSKYDLDGDGFYETQISIKELIEDPNYTCPEDCDDEFTEAKQVCTDKKTSCKNDCDDSDCREDCDADYDYCDGEAKDQNSDCTEGCEVVYSNYEMEISGIELEQVPGTNTTIITCDINNLYLCNDNVTCTEAGGYWYNNICYSEDQNVTIECGPDNLNLCEDTVECTEQGGYWYDDACNSLPEGEEECSIENLEYCEDFSSCNDVGGHWYAGNCNDEPQVIDECSSLALELCEDEISCDAAGGYWYNVECNKDSEPDDPELPKEVCSLSNPDLCGDQASCEDVGAYWYDSACSGVAPDTETPSSFMKYIIIGIVVVIIIGLSIGGYFYMKANGDFGVHEKIEPKSDKEQIFDYLIKQLESGYDMNNITASLKKLGWDAALVDEAANEFLSNPTKMKVVEIVRYAVHYNVRNPQVIQQNFYSVDPKILSMAVSDLIKLDGGNSQVQQTQQAQSTPQAQQKA